MDILKVNTPEGSRDRLFSECRDRRKIEESLTAVFKSHDYSEIITPESEYYDLFVQSGNPLPQESMVKIVDRSGKILVMRPDNTTPIARVVATRLRENKAPIRLYYNQSVFRSDAAHVGNESEIPQCGVELIGLDDIDGDIEVISMAIESLKACGMDEFHIELGHAGIFRALSRELGAGYDVSEKIRDCIENKKFAVLKDMLQPYIDNPAAKFLSRMAYLFGGVDVLKEAWALTDIPEVISALDYLRRLYDEIERRGDGDKVRFDLGIVHKIDYYTGVVFRGYVPGAAADALSGGRYNNLLSYFGKEAPATGFAINTNAVEAGIKQAESSSSGRLKIAITKGRLLDQSVELFEKMGLDCTPVKNPGRKLVHEIPNYGLDVVMSKAPDVITYVEHGVCDIGIVGKDTILEHGNSFYEVLDLGFGKCRFALAVKTGEDFYGTYKTRRIASKYPKVAESYFAEKGVDVSVIKIEGSVELAPILGLADGIVDIVETGSTLKANGLVPIETIHEVSARLIVNTASMKLYRDQILDFIGKCERVLCSE